MNPSATASNPGTAHEVPDLYIGLMSGTSMDGVDAVLVSLPPLANRAIQKPSPLKVLAHVHKAYPDALVNELLSLNHAGPDELHRAALAANAVTEIYAMAVQQLLEASSVKSRQITAIAAHGQTVRHQPRLNDGSLGYTLQLNQPALLAERCGIDVVADFRNRDVAAGGQGAPLVPAFHRAVFGEPGEHRAVLNIGGISNLSLLKQDGSCLGLDCGPGNVLMDLWCKQHRGTAYDEGGRWAASGRIVAPLLDALLAEPYISKPAPKSTGRDLFNADWLSQKLRSLKQGHVPAAPDVQATLLALTAQTIAADLNRYMREVQTVFVCGGGAYNRALMTALAQALPGVTIQTTAELGLPPEQVEAAAFAWLAWAYKHRMPGNVPAVTGAAGPRVLGALYPAG